jgi:hypothetical protein
MSAVKPITPDEVVERKKETIPDIVFEVFNYLIAENFNGHSATILQKEVDALLKKKKVNVDEAYKRHWLDVEDIYRGAGWDVAYDKPAYNETYEASFEFRPAKKRKAQFFERRG